MRFFAEIFYQGKVTKKNVALTFDDGPSSPYTIQLLEIFDQYNVKATFFVTGENIKKYPEIIRRIIAQGHELGNHSYSHRNLIFKSVSFVRKEVKKTDQLLHELGVKKEIHFRPPFGRLFFQILFVMSKLNKKIIMWNIGPKDFKDYKSEELVAKVLVKLKPGSIIVLHDGVGDRSRLVGVTEILIKSIQDKGYEFKTVSELIN